MLIVLRLLFLFSFVVYKAKNKPTHWKQWNYTLSIGIKDSEFLVFEGKTEWNVSLLFNVRSALCTHQANVNYLWKLFILWWSTANNQTMKCTLYMRIFVYNIYFTGWKCALVGKIWLSFWKPRNILIFVSVGLAFHI